MHPRVFSIVPMYIYGYSIILYALHHLICTASSYTHCISPRYERLVKETSATINKLFNFLGEEYSEEDIMAFYTQSADWNLFSSSSSSSDQAGSTAAGNNNDSSGITNNGSNGGKAISSKVQRPPNEAAGHEQLRSFQVTQPLYDGTLKQVVASERETRDKSR